MADKVTLGGDRLGSGEKIQVERHNYMMNSWNLSQDWKSSMAPGILYPCLKLVATNHGTFDIDVDHIVRTIPTQGPLFGSFKMQVDFFNIPFRLYQGILHNNPTNMGMNMNRVYLPKMFFKIPGDYITDKVAGANRYDWQINDSSLEKYLGLSGYGEVEQYTPEPGQKKYVARKIQCVPELAYYDIFKCYYANKQEENAYVITPGTITEVPITLLGKIFIRTTQTEEYELGTTIDITNTRSTIITTEILRGTINDAKENINLNIIVGENEESIPLDDWLQEENTPIVFNNNGNYITITTTKTALYNYFNVEEGNIQIKND